MVVELAEREGRRMLGWEEGDRNCAKLGVNYSSRKVAVCLHEYHRLLCFSVLYNSYLGKYLKYCFGKEKGMKVKRCPSC